MQTSTQSLVLFGVLHYFHLIYLFKRQNILKACLNNKEEVPEEYLSSLFPFLFPHWLSSKKEKLLDLVPGLIYTWSALLSVRWEIKNC